MIPVEIFHYIASFGTKLDTTILSFTCATFSEIYSKNRIANECLAENAAKEGHVELLQWLKDSNYDIIPSVVSEYAAEGGSVAVLQWLKENNLLVTDRLMVKLASFGHLEALKWANLPVNENVVKNGLLSGNIELYKWLKDKNSDKKIDWCKYAVRSGNIELVKAVVENSTEKCYYAINEAIILERLDIIKYLHEKGYELAICFAIRACCNKNTEVLEWLLQRDRIYSPDNVYQEYIREGNLNLIKVLYAHGYRCTNIEYECLYYNKPEILEWYQSM